MTRFPVLIAAVSVPLIFAALVIGLWPSSVSAHDPVPPDQLRGVPIPQVATLPGGTQIHTATFEVVSVPLGSTASYQHFNNLGQPVPWNFTRWGDLDPRGAECNRLLGGIVCDDAQYLMSTNIAQLCEGYATAGFSLSRRHHVRERLKELGTSAPGACGFGR